MTTAEIKKAKRDWLALREEIRARIIEGAPARDRCIVRVRGDIYVVELTTGRLGRWA